MARKIYKIFYGIGHSSYFSLPQEQQADLIVKSDQSVKRHGGEALILCDSYWADEHTPFFGIERYPNVEAVQKHAADLLELSWTELFSSGTLLGVATPNYENLSWTFGSAKESATVYKLSMARRTAVSHQLTDEAMSAILEELAKKREASGGKIMLYGKIWTSEHWNSFILEEFPSADAAMEFHLAEQEMGFMRHVDAFVLLGTPAEPYTGLEWSLS
jgi:hypothetical protein